MAHTNSKNRILEVIGYLIAFGMVVFFIILLGTATLPNGMDKFEYCESLGYETTLLATDYTNDFYCTDIGQDKTITRYKYINFSKWINN